MKQKTSEKRARRVRTVEYDPGFGWIARNPATGQEIQKDFRWTSRSVARDVVDQARRLATGPALTTMPGAQAAVYAEETGVDYATALVRCNMD